MVRTGALKALSGAAETVMAGAADTLTAGAADTVMAGAADTLMAGAADRLTAAAADSRSLPIFARVSARRTLCYDILHPNYGPHVRAGSGLAWVDAELAIVQDDALCIAWLKPDSGALRLSALPPALADSLGAHTFDAAAGNKLRKPDFEAAFSWAIDGKTELVALGSGSSMQRFHIIRVQNAGATCSVLDGSRWLTALSENHAFAGSQLNIEGASCNDQQLFLFQRGNGAAVNGLAPVNAVAAFEVEEVRRFLDAPATAAVPNIARLYPVELAGFWHGGKSIPWGFADACEHQARTWFLLSAEASPDVLDDGEVAAAALGYLTDSGAVFGLIHDENGQILRDKLEGLASDGRGGFYAVTDNDDPTIPAQLLHLELGHV